MKSFVHAVVALTALSAALPATASAETNVIVLGIRSVEGDDDLARNLTGALRGAVSRVPDWSVADAEVSLSQMTMVHGCDEPDARCMGQIAEELGQQRVIYGTVRRTSAGENYDFALTLYMFNAESGQIEDSLTDNIPRIQTDIDDLRPRAVRYVTQFSGMTRFGTVRLTAVPGAVVEIDDQAVGTTDESGMLMITDVAEGSRSVHIEADGYDDFSGTLTVTADEQLDFRATMLAHESSNLGWIPAVGLMVVGAGAMAAGTFAFWIPNLKDRQARSDIHTMCDREDCTSEIMAANTRLQGMGAVTRGQLFDDMVLTSNQSATLCSEAQLTSITGTTANRRARDICDEQDKRKTLSIVFNVVGLAALGTGIGLLIAWLGSSDDDASARSRFQLTPTASTNSAGLLGHLEF